MRQELLAIVIAGGLGFVEPIASAQEKPVGTYAGARTTLAFKIRYSSGLTSAANRARLRAIIPVD